MRIFGANELLGGEKLTWYVNGNRLLFLLVVFSVLAIYYVVGGYGFPDYRNYITLAENNGYISSPDEYAAEWISRFFLRNGFGVLDSAVEVVDFFAAFIQVFYIVFILSLMKDEDILHQRGWLFFTLALSPLLLTTALRAAPAYIIIAYLAYYGRFTSLRFLLLSLLAISFHDSAILMVVLFVLSCVFCNVFKRVNASFIRKVMWLSVLLIVFSEQFSLLFVSLISNFDFGIRAAYFQSPESASLVKKIFVLFAWYIAYTSLFNKLCCVRTKVFICAAALLMALSFSISEVAGIRIAGYVIGVSVVSKGAFLLSGNEGDKLRQVDLLCGFMYFVVMFYDIFRNVKVS